MEEHSKPLHLEMINELRALICKTLDLIWQFLNMGFSLILQSGKYQWQASATSPSSFPRTTAWM